MSEILITPYNCNPLSILEDESNDDCLFLFCDNLDDNLTCRPGWSLGLARPYNRYSSLVISDASHLRKLSPPHPRPRSCGIVVGYTALCDFLVLTCKTQTAIDSSIEDARELIVKYNFKRVGFSYMTTKEMCGAGGDSSTQRQSFVPEGICSPEVAKYVNNAVYSLGSYSSPSNWML